MKTILFVTILFLVGCESVPTPEVKDIAGKKHVKVLKKLGPITVSSKWEPVKSNTDKVMEDISAPAKLVNKIVIPGFIVALALTLVSQCPMIQKRSLKVALVCGAAMPVCWAIMFATSTPLIFIPIILGMAFVLYSVCRKRGLLFSSREES
jgi:hypothetical protein